MSADDPEAILDDSYSPTSRRQDAVSIAAGLVVGIAVYALTTGIPAVRGALQGFVSPSLLSIGIALIAYYLIDAWMMRR